MATTPHLGLTLVEQSQAQKEITVNMALMRIDALLNSGVLDKDLATPPAAPEEEGDVYIVADAATDAWEGRENQVAYFEQVWRFIAPNKGLMLWVADEGAFYLFDGSAWGATSGGASLSGLSDVVFDSPAHGEVLTFDSVTGGWVNDTIAGGGSGEANTASNVNGSGGGVFKDKSGAELRFNNIVAGSNVTISGGGASGGDVTITGVAAATSPALDDVTDVVLSSVVSGEVLAYDGSEWINRTLVEAGIAAASHTHVLADVTDAGTLAGKSSVDNGDWSGADLAVANGGTGLSSVAADCLLAGNGAAALSETGVKVDSDDCLSGFKGKINAQTSTTYTLASGDTGKIVECTNASAITLTLPNSLPQGFTCTVVQSGAGDVTFDTASGATLNNRQSHTKTAGQYAMTTVYVSTNSGGTSAVYVLAGDTL